MDVTYKENVVQVIRKLELYESEITDIMEEVNSSYLVDYELAYNKLLSTVKGFKDLKRAVINEVDELKSTYEKQVLDVTRDIVEIKEDMKELVVATKEVITLVEDSQKFIAVQQLNKSRANGKIKLPHPAEKISEEDLKQLYLKEGKSCKEIADMYDMQENSIRSRLKKIGIWQMQTSK